MYPVCIVIASEDRCILHVSPHVSRMSPACLLHIRYISLDAFEIHVSCMYLACIPNVSNMYLDCLSGYMYPTCISRMYLAFQIHASLDACETHVSHHVS